MSEAVLFVNLDFTLNFCHIDEMIENIKSGVYMIDRCVFLKVLEFWTSLSGLHIWYEFVLCFYRIDLNQIIMAQYSTGSLFISAQPSLSPRVNKFCAWTEIIHNSCSFKSWCFTKTHSDHLCLYISQRGVFLKYSALSKFRAHRWFSAGKSIKSPVSPISECAFIAVAFSSVWAIVVSHKKLFSPFWLWGVYIFVHPNLSKIKCLQTDELIIDGLILNISQISDYCCQQWHQCN